MLYNNVVWVNTLIVQFCLDVCKNGLLSAVAVVGCLACSKHEENEKQHDTKQNIRFHLYFLVSDDKVTNIYSNFASDLKKDLKK